jgi:Predicted Fe-S oxidoreductases
LPGGQRRRRGRPANDGRRATWYAVLDLDQGRASAELVPVAYDWRAQAASMRAAGLPEPFVETIETGWWTTCLEIVPPAERSRGRFHVYREGLPSGFEDPRGAGFADPPPPEGDDRPVVSLFGTAAFPARLWIYTNFHCNLACDYCVVASSPRARRRTLSLERVRELVDEAVDEGFSEVYLTGGEPFVHPEIVAMLEYASDRIDTVVLTNAMLFGGRRGDELRRLAGRDRLVLQSSLDGAHPETHDRWRGAGLVVRRHARDRLRPRARNPSAHSHDRDPGQPRRGRGAALAPGRRRRLGLRLRRAPARRARIRR